ncbi:MAG: hypothetical protein ACREQQ_05675 [Candidatus Binatia bacterium]
MDTRILFVAALGWEARAISSQINKLDEVAHGESRLFRGAAASAEIAVMQTGIGPERAARAISWAGEIVAPSVVIVTGCAGALVPGLATGEMVVADEIVTPAEATRDASARWVERCLRACRAARGVRRGRLLVSSSVLVNAEEKRRAAAETRSIAVAMEDGVVAAWAAARGLEFASVRVVLDGAETAIPEEILAMAGARGNVLPGRVLAAVARRPRLIVELLKLGAAQRLCRRTLELVHRRLLDDLRAP